MLGITGSLPLAEAGSHRPVALLCQDHPWQRHQGHVHDEQLSALGVEIAMGASEGLHTSGHAYRCVSVVQVSSSCMERCKLSGHEFGDAV